MRELAPAPSRVGTQSPRQIAVSCGVTHAAVYPIAAPCIAASTTKSRCWTRETTRTTPRAVRRARSRSWSRATAHGSTMRHQDALCELQALEDALISVSRVDPRAVREAPRIATTSSSHRRSGPEAGELRRRGNAIASQRRNSRSRHASVSSAMKCALDSAHAGYAAGSKRGGGGRARRARSRAPSQPLMRAINRRFAPQAHYGAKRAVRGCGQRGVEAPARCRPHSSPQSPPSPCRPFEGRTIVAAGRMSVHRAPEQRVP